MQRAFLGSALRFPIRFLEKARSQQGKGSWAYFVEACVGHICEDFYSPDLLTDPGEDLYFAYRTGIKSGPPQS